MDARKEVTIVTHSSKFHPDDVFGVATLLLVLEKDNNVKVVRSRDPEIVSRADFKVDVGGVYDSEKNYFDHHQTGGAGVRDNTVPYASFGLVWKKHGEQLCQNKEIAEKIDQLLVQPIDAYDNGVEFVQTTIENLRPIDIRELMYVFRPTWKEDTDLDALFLKLVGYAQVILFRFIKTKNDEREARELVMEAYNTAEDKRVIILDERYPWEEVLMQLPEPLFVVYPKRVDNTWSLKTISNGTRYQSRKDLPESWAGKNDEELEKITGVSGSIFCHNRRFLAVAKTKEAILELAQIALKS